MRGNSATSRSGTFELSHSTAYMPVNRAFDVVAVKDGLFARTHGIRTLQSAAP